MSVLWKSFKNYKVICKCEVTVLLFVLNIKVFVPLLTVKNKGCTLLSPGHGIHACANNPLLSSTPTQGSGTPVFRVFFVFWLRWVFVAVRRLSLVAASEGYSSLQCMGCSSRWLLLLWSTASRHVGCSNCSV